MRQLLIFLTIFTLLSFSVFGAECLSDLSNVPCNITSDLTLSGGNYDISTAGTPAINFIGTDITLDCVSSQITCSNAGDDVCLNINRSSHHITIKNCNIQQSDRAIYVNSNDGYNLSGLNVDKNNITTDEYCIFLQGNNAAFVENVNVTNNICTTLSSGDATRFIGGGVPINNLYIYNNANYDSDDDNAFTDLNSCPNNVIIDSNYVYGGSLFNQLFIGAPGLPPCDNIQITNNYFNTTLISLGDFNVTNLLIENNTWLPGQATSMVLSGNAYFEGKVKNNNMYAIDLTGILGGTYGAVVISPALGGGSAIEISLIFENNNISLGGGYAFDPGVSGNINITGGTINVNNIGYPIRVTNTVSLDSIYAREITFLNAPNEDIYISDMSYIEIHNNTFNAENGIKLDGVTNEVLVRGNLFNSGSSGIKLEGTHSTSQISFNTFSSSTSWDINVSGTINTLNINNNDFDGADKCLNFLGNGENVNIYSNTFTTCDNAIELNQIVGFSIYSNIIGVGGYGIRLGDTNTNGKIYSNTFNSVSQAVRMESGTNKVNVTSNNFYTSTQNSIYATGVTNIQAKSNYMTGKGMTWLSSSGLLISGNTIINTSSYAVETTTTNTTVIQDNILTETSGISLNNSIDTTISTNTISSTNTTVSAVTVTESTAVNVSTNTVDLQTSQVITGDESVNNVTGESNTVTNEYAPVENVVTNYYNNVTSTTKKVNNTVVKVSIIMNNTIGSGIVTSSKYNSQPASTSVFVAPTKTSDDEEVVLESFDVFVAPTITGTVDITKEYTSLPEGTRTSSLNLYVWYGGAWVAGSNPIVDTTAQTVTSTFPANYFTGSPLIFAGLTAAELAEMRDSCLSTRATIFAAFALLAISIIVVSAFGIIKLSEGGGDVPLIIITIGGIALAIVLFIGYYVISTVGQSICNVVI